MPVAVNVSYFKPMLTRDVHSETSMQFDVIKWDYTQRYPNEKETNDIQGGAIVDEGPIPSRMCARASTDEQILRPAHLFSQDGAPSVERLQRVY